MDEFKTALVIVIIFFFGFFMGGIVFSDDGDRYCLSNDETYNFIAFVDKDAPVAGDDTKVVELIVSDTNDPDDHRFVFVFKECADTYKDGARYLLKLSDTNCVWLP